MAGRLRRRCALRSPHGRGCTLGLHEVRDQATRRPLALEHPTRRVPGAQLGPDRIAFIRAEGRLQDHRHVLHRRMPAEGALDFRELHAMPADLHLLVVPAQKTELALSRPRREVTRGVHPSFMKGIGSEARGGLLWHVQVALGHARPRDEQFAHESWREQCPGRIQHVQPGPRDGPADRCLVVRLSWGRAHSSTVPQHVYGAPHGGFRRTILVEQPGLGQQPSMQNRHGFGARLTCDDHGIEPANVDGSAYSSSVR